MSVSRVRVWIMYRAALWRVSRYARAIATGRLSFDEADRRLERDLRFLGMIVGLPTAPRSR